MKQLSFVVFGLVFLTGCASSPFASTPREQREQDARMMGFLNDSSPRNTNGIPKALPEFTDTYTDRCTVEVDRVRVQNPATAESPAVMNTPAAAPAKAPAASHHRAVVPKSSTPQKRIPADQDPESW